MCRTRAFVNSNALTFMAGPGALESIRSNGFDIAQIGTIAGASGGAKWLVLSQLDRAIANLVLPRLTAPVHLIGTSIGCWRAACFAQRDPRAAIDRFETAYLEQTYSDNPDSDEITAQSRAILRTLLGDNGVHEILEHPVLRMHVLAVRSRHLLNSERRATLSAGLLAAAALNAASRRSLGRFFERALFYDRRDPPPCIDAMGFSMQKIPLSADNLEDVIVATGSIPLVLNGVTNIAGAAEGTYRDGGVIDYHLDLPVSAPGRYTLFPHFLGRIVPGWFDKRLSWRRPKPEHVDRTILVCPSDEFVARLPHGKIPDRRDFRNFSTRERIKNWRRTVAACQELADEFATVIESNSLPDRLQPLL